VFAALDKVTGRISHLEIPINQTVQFGALKVTPRVCNSRPPTEPPHTDSFVEVDEIKLTGEVERIFTGWMFAAVWLRNEQRHKWMWVNERRYYSGELQSV
jgi:hypothetical protein